ncbi:hypothetical protein [Pedobacter antarcticus]|uniref:Uncharacterized protein n=2 Tax=Pedobacter antarcticus TaxID=34086 RepID=A0A081PDE4_9SPHI|nr:hypothetical protein [Pedobacter antarcticus]KEQ28717.1 hypothetical protein N180_04815 [Pedobacter antarcticus 4BY]SDL68607.1 hypothetical protein SAMN04488084_102103 [Pedobacter antarcticus]SFE89591.1 hypothetical protein SAMN03003324_01703 [Pedobacter antarcticus]
MEDTEGGRYKDYRMNKTLIIKHLALATLSYLLMGCSGNSNLQNSKNIETNSLVNTYIKSIHSQGVIQISDSPCGAVNRDCLNEIFTKYKFDVPFEETFQAQETDTVAWTKAIIDTDSVKILNSAEVKFIKETPTFGGDESIDKTFYVISNPIFSKDHRFAILNKYFYCGGRCGNGSVLIYEKKGGEWILREEVCPIVS